MATNAGGFTKSVEISWMGGTFLAVFIMLSGMAMAVIASTAEINALPMLAVFRLNNSCMANSIDAAIPANKIPQI